jgi:hypothetical protein
MDPLGLVVHDEQTFFGKVIKTGMEEGLFTRDRADEIIRISVAMANKYVLEKEIDFRSTEELAKVQETILKLVGVGLEIKSKGDLEEAIPMLMDASPVELFRLAYTRIGRLRSKWRRLLQDHRVDILVSAHEFHSLGDLSVQRLSEMSAFTESEVYSIGSLKLGDELFSSLSMVEYYESELERYQFILRLRKILPFDLLNRSGNVCAENLADVDSIREALVSSFIVSAFVDSPDPVAVTMKDVRDFLARLDLSGEADMFSEELEEVVLDLIHELGEGLQEHEVSLLTQEIIRITQKLLEVIAAEWETVGSENEETFFKRWSRLVILADTPDPLNRILSSDGPVDQFDFEFLVEQLLKRSEGDVEELVKRLPWKRLMPLQIITLFQRAHPYQAILAGHVSLAGFSTGELVDLLEEVDTRAFKKMLPALKEILSGSRLPLDELRLFAGLPQREASKLLRIAGPPAEMDPRRLLIEYDEGSETVRRVLIFSCWGSEYFAELLAEAWAIDPDFIKKQIRTIPPSEIGDFFHSAAGVRPPKVVVGKKGERHVKFSAPELNSLFKWLPESKKRAVVKYFTKHV